MSCFENYAAPYDLSLALRGVRDIMSETLVKCKRCQLLILSYLCRTQEAPMRPPLTLSVWPAQSCRTQPLKIISLG
jgi:hypothetical protein